MLEELQEREGFEMMGAMEEVDEQEVVGKLGEQENLEEKVAVEQREVELKELVGRGG